MNIRSLLPTDADEYRTLMLEGYALAADAFTTTAEERAAEPIEWWQRRISDHNQLSRAFAAFQSEQMVGTVTVEYSAKPKAQHKAFIIGTYVSAAYRKLGVGRALLDAAIHDVSSRAHIKVVTLSLTDGKDQARRLYESVGFKQFDLEPMAIFTGIEYKSKSAYATHTS